MVQESNALTVRQEQAAIMEQVIIKGDLKDLKPEERVQYYNAVCNSLGLNPLTKPFDYLYLNNKLVLYANRSCTDQLRATRTVTTTIVSREVISGVYVVTARATLPDGRTDESIGAVSIEGLKGDALANAFMKAETKSKRRVTLSVVGLGWLDESEIETIAGAKTISADTMDAPASAPKNGGYKPQPVHTDPDGLPFAPEPEQSIERKQLIDSIQIAVKILAWPPLFFGKEIAKKFNGKATTQELTVEELQHLDKALKAAVDLKAVKANTPADNTTVTGKELPPEL